MRILIKLICIAWMVAPAWAQPVRQEDDSETPPEVKLEQPNIAPVTPRVPQPAIPVVRGKPTVDPVEDLIVRSQKGGVTLGTLIDELVDELAHQISKEDPKPLSPLAVRLVRLSPNLNPALAQSIEAKIVARLGSLPGLEQVVCLECRSVRSRVEGGDWVVTLGATRMADLRRIGQDIGAKAFLDVDVTFNQIPPTLTLAAKIYRASDAHVLWTAAYRGDETTAAVLRTGKIPPSREEQLKEFKRKLEARPYFGYMAFLGFMYVSSNGPQGGYPSLNVGMRLFERFGTDRRHMYGLQAEAVLDWGSQHSLFAGAVSAGYWYSLLKLNVNRPSELRVGATGGAFIAGTDGNTAIFQVMLEYVLQFRLAFNAGALYMVPAKYADGFDVGGFGGAARFAFSW
jgi:hypothetical protein